MALSPDARAALIDHLTNRLVGHFGADAVVCQLGKNEPSRHRMREVAAAAIAHLAPVLDDVDAANVVIPDRLGPPTPTPWDDHWRSQPRTAGWRS